MEYFKYNNYIKSSHEFNNIQRNILITCTSIISFISFISCNIIILIFLFRPKLRNFIFKLVICIAISESIYSLSKFLVFLQLFDINTNLGAVLCYIQASIITYTDFCTLLFLIIMGICLNDLMVNYNKNIFNKLKVFIIIGYIIPLFGVSALM